MQPRRLCIFVFWLCLGAGGGVSRIGSIDLRGASPARLEQLRRCLTLRPGDLLDSARVRADVQRLWASRLVDDVRVESRPDGDGVALTFVVVPRRALGQLTLPPLMNARAAQAIRAELPPGTPLTTARLDELKQALLAIARHAEHPWATVTLHTHAIGDDALDVDATLDPGPPGVLELRLRGVRPSLAAPLRAIVPPPPDLLDPALAERTALMTAAFYYERGFINVRVPPLSIVEARDQGRITITLTVDEGEPYQLRALTIRGADVDERCREVPRHATFVRSQIGHCIDRVRARYRETHPRGEVTPETSIDVAHRAVDVTLVLADPPAR